MLTFPPCHHTYQPYAGLPQWLISKESTCQCKWRKRCRFIPGSVRSSGSGNGNPLQYSHLGNPMDRGAWQAAVHGVGKSQTQLSAKSKQPVMCINQYRFQSHPQSWAWAEQSQRTIAKASRREGVYKTLSKLSSHLLRGSCDEQTQTTQEELWRLN